MKPLDPVAIELEKSSLIEASAGTGKTYTITSLVLRLLAKGYPIESVLVVTFTEAAAAELKLRIRTRLHNTLKELQNHSDESEDVLVSLFRSAPDIKVIENRLALALSCFDQAAVMTIHSFCYKVLKEFSFESQTFFDIELVPDRSLFLNQAAYDFFMDRVSDQDPLFLSYLATQQATPENFIVSFSKALSRPDIRVLPAPVAFEDVFDEYRKIAQQIEQILNTDMDGVIQLIADNKGIDKRSYSKKNVPAWLGATKDKLAAQGGNTLFNMTEKGDALYKFTTQRLKSKLKAGFDLPVHPLFDCCEQLLGVTKIFADNLIALKQDFIQFLRNEFKKIKLTRGICFFDDLVNDLSDVLHGPLGKQLIAAVRQNYTACLIDEFQDTDPRQYDIFSRLFARPKTPFFMIGDPKQAIYAFRGGDIFAYLKAVSQSEQQFTLDKNYRSAPLLVEGVNRVFQAQPAPFVYKDITFSPVSYPDGAVNRFRVKDKELPALQIGFIRRDTLVLDRQGFIPKKSAQTLIPEVVAADIQCLLTSGKGLKSGGDTAPDRVRPSDIAVLVRTNVQAGQIKEALSDLNIPSYQSKTGSVFDATQAVELNDILKAVYEPESTSLLKAALCTSVFGFTSQQLLRLDTDEDTYFFWHDFFGNCKTIWEQRGFVSMIMTLLHSEHGFLKGNWALDERALTNFYHLIELISQAGTQFLFSAFHLMKWYEAQLCESLRDEFADELRLESDKHAVAIVTIHKSKGLEYPVVYLPYLWEGQRAGGKKDIVFHDPACDDQLTLDLGSKGVDHAAACHEKEDLAEQRRLLYVALTRASGMCRIVWGAFASAASSSLGALLHPGGCKEDAVMLQDLESLAQSAPSSIVVDTIDTQMSGQTYMTESDQGKDFSSRNLSRDIRPAWKMSSFSAIVHGAGGEEPLVHASDPADGQTDIIGLETFPKGPTAGDFFHAVFENSDFSGPDDAIDRQVAHQLGRYGFTDPSLKSMAQQNIRQVLKTPLENGTSSLMLKKIRPDMRLNEMAFTLKVASLSRHLLCDVLKKGSPVLSDTGYIDRISLLDTATIDGFLKGFIDMVFRYKGQYFIADYKSNYLGSTYDAYSQANMKTAMAGHHYYLQYHIYLLALHRYLSQRMPDYDYDTHIGGVYYFFIRGMHKDYGSRFGVFFDRPPGQSICDLSERI